MVGPANVMAIASKGGLEKNLLVPLLTSNQVLSPFPSCRSRVIEYIDHIGGNGNVRKQQEIGALFDLEELPEYAHFAASVNFD